MQRRWLTRALIALVAPAVLVPALIEPATAATVKVPTVAAVAKVYPHLTGGTATQSVAKVYGPGKKCKTGKAIKGASQRSASYSPDYSSGDPTVYLMTGLKPGVSVTAMKFPTTKAAVKYLHGYASFTKKCAGSTSGGGTTSGVKCKASSKKIRFTLGNERWGYQTRSRCTISGTTTDSVFNTLFARKGRVIVYTNAMSMDATAPSTAQSIALTKLALKTAR